MLMVGKRAKMSILALAALVGLEYHFTAKMKRYQPIVSASHLSSANGK